MIARIIFSVLIIFGCNMVYGGLYLYDDFSTGGIDASKWTTEISGDYCSISVSGERGLLDTRHLYWAVPSGEKGARMTFNKKFVFEEDTDVIRFTFDMLVTTNSPTQVAMSSWANGVAFGDGTHEIRVGQLGNCGNNGADGAHAGKFFSSPSATLSSNFPYSIMYHYDIVMGTSVQAVSVYEYNSDWAASPDTYSTSGTLVWSSAEAVSFETDTEYSLIVYVDNPYTNYTTLNRKAAVFIDNLYISVVPDPIVAQDSYNLYITPETETTILFDTPWTFNNSELQYVIRDFAGNSVGSGTAVATGNTDEISVTLNLAQGFYELHFSNFGSQRVGVVVLPVYSANIDAFFGIGSIFSVQAAETKLALQLSEITSGIQILSRLGIGSIRELSHWFLAEAIQGSMNWDYRYTSDIHATALLNNVKVLDFEGHFPSWSYTGSYRYVPTELFEIKDSISNMATEWESSRCGYQILNEVEALRVSAEEAAAVTKYFSWLLKDQNISTPIVGSAFTEMQQGPEMLRVCFENKFLDAIDVFAFHDYGLPSKTIKRIKFFRDAMSGYSRGSIPFWITESGERWPTGTYRPTVGYGEQSALRIVRKAIEAKAAGVKKYFPFTMMFFPEVSNNFGMTDNYLSPLLAMGAYGNCVKWLANYEYIGDVPDEIPGVVSARVFRSSINNYWAALVLATAGHNPYTVGPIPDYADLVKIEAIDGSTVTLNSDRTVTIPGGLLYLRVPVWSIGTQHGGLNPNTTARDLYLTASTWNSPARITSPVVMQFNPTSEPTFFRWYDYQPSNFSIKVWNFSDTSKTISPALVLPDGVTSSNGPSLPVTIPAETKITLSWNLNWNNVSYPGVNNVYVVDNNAIASQLMVSFNKAEEDGDDVIIFNDSLQNNFAYTSVPSGLDVGVSDEEEPVFSGAASIRMQAADTSDEMGMAASSSSAPVVPSGHTVLRFALYLQDTSSFDNIKVTIYNSTSEYLEFNESNSGLWTIDGNAGVCSNLTQGKWYLVKINLPGAFSSLIVDSTKITSVTVTNSSEYASAVYYIDDIRLTDN